MADALQASVPPQVQLVWEGLREVGSRVNPNGHLLVHPGAIEEEAVGCNALPSQGALSVVLPALCTPQGSSPYPA
ncbi:hypothetical protein QTO34_018200 [Cnephaeus nilssonii]|uniref:Uncharacterized protein n=1 Tax=Cnephaeus nilssonii TaxID=3371016 RepID=A0AA40LMV4_CNENI|nr:hypothetical protein QTO34_018200 [Eptesicus nilssonii]